MLKTQSLDHRTSHSVWGFIREIKTEWGLVLTMPQVLMYLIYTFVFELNIDNWILNGDEIYGIFVSSDKRIASNRPTINPILKKNVKGNNIILTTCYDNIRRICYCWTLKCLSSLKDHWEIGVEGLDNICGFHGMNQDGFPVTRGLQQGLYPTISYYFYTRRWWAFDDESHSWGKKVKYGDVLKIKIYFYPESPNRFDVEFHKNGRLFFEFRSLKCGDRISLSLNFVKQKETSSRDNGFQIMHFEKRCNVN